MLYVRNCRFRRMQCVSGRDRSSQRATRRPSSSRTVQQGQHSHSHDLVLRASLIRAIVRPWTCLCAVRGFALSNKEGCIVNWAFVLRSDGRAVRIVVDGSKPATGQTLCTLAILPT